MCVFLTELLTALGVLKNSGRQFGDA